MAMLGSNDDESNCTDYATRVRRATLPHRKKAIKNSELGGSDTTRIGTGGSASRSILMPPRAGTGCVVARITGTKGGPAATSPSVPAERTLTSEFVPSSLYTRASELGIQQ
jgi:hypothetical protein